MIDAFAVPFYLFVCVVLRCHLTVIPAVTLPLLVFFDYYPTLIVHPYVSAVTFVLIVLPIGLECSA